MRGFPFVGPVRTRLGLLRWLGRGFLRLLCVRGGFLGKEHRFHLLYHNFPFPLFRSRLFRRFRRGFRHLRRRPDQAAQLLKDEKPLVQAYVMDQIFDKMQGNEAAIAPYYAGDAINMMAVNDSLRFVIPKEGTNLFFDAVCIPKHREDTEESRLRKLASEMYINFLNEPDIAAANIDYIQYSTPNDAALELLDEETRSNPIAYPSDEALKNTEVYVNLSEDTNLYLDQLWTQIMSAEAGYNYWSMPLFLLGTLALSIGITVMKKNRRRRRERFDYESSNF